MKQTQFKGDWRKVFGEKYQVPKEIERNFLDQSHKNSLCPSFYIGNNGEEEITLWVEHPDLEERVTNHKGERMHSDACQERRFLFMGLDEELRCRTLLETDNEEFAIKHAKAMKEYLENGKIPGSRRKIVLSEVCLQEMQERNKGIKP